MSVLPKIDAFASDLTAIRHDLHAHPELGFEETRTAGIVAEQLRAYGVDEVHEGLGGTGVVAVIRGQGWQPSYWTACRYGCTAHLGSIGRRLCLDQPR